MDYRSNRLRGTNEPGYPNDHRARRPGSGFGRRFTLGEKARGAMELAIVTAVIWRAVVEPDLLSLPAVAIAALVLVGIIVWDDRIRDSRTPQRGEQIGEPRTPRRNVKVKPARWIRRSLAQEHRSMTSPRRMNASPRRSRLRRRIR